MTRPLFRDCFQHLHGVERKRIPPTPPGALRLHRLERAIPWSMPDKSKFAEELMKTEINHYPDYDEFHTTVARWQGRPKEQVVIGAGIEDFIRSLFILCADPGETVAYTWPTCAMFDVYAEVFDVVPHRIPLWPDRVPIFDFPASTRLLIWPNPGQPVDNQSITMEDLRRLAGHCQKIGAVFAIDEAYHGFGAKTALPLIDEFDNVLILRTFSKAFGGAALRVAYAMGQPTVTQPLNAIRESGEIAGPSMAIAAYLIHGRGSVLQDARTIAETRDEFVRQLCGEPDIIAARWKAHNSRANHVLLDVLQPSVAVTLQKALANRGIFIRGGYAEPLDHHLLITVGSHEDMKRVRYEMVQVASILGTL